MNLFVETMEWRILTSATSSAWAQQKWTPKNVPKELKDDLYFNWEFDLLNSGSNFTSKTWNKETT